MRAFMVYVRPIVEYNSIIWSPSTAHDIDAVESVQLRFTKRLPTLNTIQYNTIHKIFIERDYTELSRGANKTWTLKLVKTENIYTARLYRYSVSNNGVTLKNRLGSFKVIEMAPFNRQYATFYWSAFVNIALSCAIFELFVVE